MIDAAKRRILIPLLALVAFGALDAAAETRLLRYPDILDDTLVFCYGGDIYTATTGGEDVTRITDLPGEESHPKLSPDGRRIAFTAEFDGGRDVYVVSIDGGEPVRLTYHAAEDLVVDWHPDGSRILFRSNRSSHSYRYRRLFEVSVTGGLPVALDLMEAETSSYDAVGDRVAFCRTSTETLMWKGYRGGAAPDIWIYDRSRDSAEPVIDGGSINHHPVWIGDRIYFLSDRGAGAEQNLWSADTGGGSLRQITDHRQWSVRWPSGGRDRIVYEHAGRLVVHDTVRDETSVVSIQIDMPDGRPVAEKNVADRLGVPALSPDGELVMLSARGDLFLHDPATNDTRNITRSSHANERSPVWSPDGASIAYISDRSGEEQIYVQRIDDDGDAVQVSRCDRTRIGSLSWSPTGDRIGYSDKRACYYTIELESGNTTRVFFDGHQGSRRFASASWSPDGRWLAYTLGHANQNRSVHLYSLEHGKHHRVTDASFSAADPRFDPRGEYLYWISDCRIDTRRSHLDGDHHMVDPSRIIVATLREDAFAPFDPNRAALAAGDEAERMPLIIDTEGIGSRIVALPTAPSHFSRLTTCGSKLVYQSEPDEGAPSTKFFDMATGTESELMGSVWYHAPAVGAEKLVYLGPGVVGVVDIAADQEVGDGAVDLSGLTMRIDYEQEWRQIFAEAWRLQRDFFYDEDMLGVDWTAMKQKYEALLPHVAFRQDLNALIEQLYSELGQSHVEIYGGDFPGAASAHGGVLGVDLVWDDSNGSYRITRICRGESRDPDRASPLLQPGLNVETGDHLLAIDGTPLTEDLSPYALLQDKAGETVSLTTRSSTPDADARTVQVRAMPFAGDAEHPLRYNEWVRENMEKVDRISRGRIGYVHIPDTYLLGIESFFRHFYAQRHKDAVILDIRYNSGGYAPFWMIERLNRRPLFESHHPYGRENLTEPDPALYGPAVCLTNEWAESGGDIFAAYFRLMGRGPVIGTRTAGNLASSKGFRLMDGGVAIYPAEGIFDGRGERIIENVGIEPDIEVANHPVRSLRGHDEQLERAVEELLRQLDSGRGGEIVH